jgi:hypothetical protein
MAPRTGVEQFSIIKFSSLGIAQAFNRKILLFRGVPKQSLGEVFLISF